jgi:hypothetical protein
VEVLPFLESVEKLGVVDDDTVKHSVQLLGVDAMRSLEIAVEPWGGGLDVGLADTSVK